MRLQSHGRGYIEGLSLAELRALLEPLLTGADVCEDESVGSALLRLSAPIELEFSVVVPGDQIAVQIIVESGAPYHDWLAAVSAALTAQGVHHFLEVPTIARVGEPGVANSSAERLHFEWPDPPGRIHQDVAFQVHSMAGARLEAFYGLLPRERSDERPTLVLIKPRGAAWQRVFLEFGFAFWEDWGHRAHRPPEPVDDGVRLVDYGARHALLGRSVLRAWCVPTPPRGYAQITLAFDGGARVILGLDPVGGDDPDMVVHVEPLNPHR
jgi:hypothetical protein